MKETYKMEATRALIKPTFLFDDRKRFEAQCEHDCLRSSLLYNTDSPLTADPWKQVPIDFTLKNFHPNRKKDSHLSFTNNRTSNEQQKEIPSTNNLVVMKPFTVSCANIKREHAGINHDNDRFVLDTRIQYDKVKRILNTEQYKNPKPHDFRQYPNIEELGLSEFDTKYARDPYKIRFLSDRLNTIWLQDRERERRSLPEKSLSKMHRALTARPKWDSKLILPKLAFPNKYAAYTRYRDPTRTVQSAYWERVENYVEQQQKKRTNTN